jgi:hypothetical protein
MICDIPQSLRDRAGLLFRWNGPAEWGIFLLPSKKHNNREG